MINLEHTLGDLDSAQLVRPAAAQELEYVFKHVMVQEAAYASLLKSARATLHLQIAETLERLSPQRHEGVAAMLEWHYGQAGREAKVLEYALMAGDAASAMRAYAEAAAHYDRAIVAARRLDPLTDSHRRLAQAAFVHRGAMLEAQNRFDEAAQNYADAIAFAAQHGDLEAESEATNHQVTVRILREGGRGQAREAAESALTLAERAGGAAATGRALWNLGLYYRFIDPERAISYFERVQALAATGEPQTRELRQLAANALTDLTLAQFTSGRNRRAEAAARRAIDEYRDLGILNLEGDALGSLALVLHMAGRPAEAREAAATCAAIGERIFSPWGTFYGRWPLAMLDVDEGQLEPHVADTALVELAEQTHFPVFRGTARALIARNWLALGFPDRALPLAEASWSAFEGVDLPTFRLSACAVRALALHATGRRAEARAAFEEMRALMPAEAEPRNRVEGLCWSLDGIYLSFASAGHCERGIAFFDPLIEMFDSEGIARFAAEARHWRGRLHLELGSLDQAEADFEHAEAWMRAAATRTLLWPLYAEQARLHDRRGDAPRAAEARGRAVAIIRDVASGIGDPALRARYLAWERTLDGAPGAGDNGPQP